MRLLLILSVSLTGCGYVGDPQAPALNIPKPVLDLRVLQRGDKIEATFTAPTTTGEALPITEAGRVELRIGPAPAPPFDLNAWLAGTREIFVEWPKIAAPPALAPTVIQAFGAQPWAGQDVILGVRLTSPTGRTGPMSNFVALSVISPLAAPMILKKESRADGIFLTWAASPQPGIQYRVTRQIGNDPAQTIADLAETQFLDLVTNFGPTYRYTLQSYVKAGDFNAVSEISPNADVAHIDIFPPTVPSGLAALAGAKSIDLGWDRSTEPDLVGYRIYRAVGDGPFVRLPTDIEPPAFRDTQVESGKRYRYAVAAVDRTGNESARSEPAEAEAP